MTRPPEVELRFYAELNDFLPPSRRQHPFHLEIAPHRTVKDVVESVGVPHTEIDLIVVNGESVSFEHRLRDGDRVSVYPTFEGLDIGGVTRLRPEPLRDPRFVLDVHLGQLARNLRLLGFDARWENHLDDAALAGISRQEHRILLTRDVGLLKRSAVSHGYWLRSTDPDRQTVEVVEHLDLAGKARPFTRCLRCAGVLDRVDKADVIEELEPGTRASYQDFRRCRECGHVYWRGAHHHSLLSRLHRWERAADRRFCPPGDGGQA